MKTIQYGRHFLLLAMAAILLWLPIQADIHIAPTADVQFVLFYGLMGAFHAGALVLSLQDRSKAMLGKAIVFVALAAAVSVATPFLGLAVASLLKFVPYRGLGDSARLVLVLVLASAGGASLYWLLVRSFWMKSLRWMDLIITVGLCALVAPLFFIPGAAWWAAFSLSLYWSEVRGLRRASKPALAQQYPPV